MEPQEGGQIGPPRPVDVVDSPWLFCRCTPGLAIRYDGLDGRIVVSDGRERLATSWPKDVDKHRDLIISVANEVGIPQAFLAGFVALESGGVATTMGGAGEVGLMQLLPSTARWLAGNDAMTVAEMAVPETNLRLGSELIRRNLEKNENNIVLAAASYNHGRVECGECRCFSKSCGPDPWGMITACGYIEGVVSRINRAIKEGYAGPIIIDLDGGSTASVEGVSTTSAVFVSIGVGVALGVAAAWGIKQWRRQR